MWERSASCLLLNALEAETRQVDYVKVTRIGSYFGNGVTSDHLMLAPAASHNSWIKLNPMIMLALLQGSLGYTLVHTDGTIWVLKRDQPFAM